VSASSAALVYTNLINCFSF